MRTIYKYQCAVRFPNDHPMPTGAHIIRVGLDPHLALCIWAEVETDNPIVNRKFVVLGTGHRIPDGYQYVGSALVGSYVWHVFEVF